MKVSIETQKHSISEREAELENRKVMFDAKSKAGNLYYFFIFCFYSIYRSIYYNFIK